MVAMVILYLPVCGVGDSFTRSLPPRSGGKQAVLGRERAEGVGKGLESQ